MVLPLVILLFSELNKDCGENWENENNVALEPVDTVHIILGTPVANVSNFLFLCLLGLLDSTEENLTLPFLQHFVLEKK